MQKGVSMDVAHILPKNTNKSDAFKEHLARKEAAKNDSREDGSVQVRITGYFHNAKSKCIRRCIVPGNTTSLWAWRTG